MDTAGSREEHLRLSIARGITTHMIMVCLLWENDGTLNASYPLNILYHQLQEAMQQIQCVEHSLGATQSELMRSLYTYSFEPRGQISSAWYVHRSSLSSLFKPKGPIIPDETFCHSCDSYRIRGLQEVAVDLIGMAASSGMVRYVCETLDLPVAKLRNQTKHLSDYKMSYSTEEAFVTRLSWAAPTRCKLDYSRYRQQLSQYLKWEAQVSSTDQTKAPFNCDTLAETYLLACCCADPFDNASSISLITMLLRAGANPMVLIKPAGDTDHEVYTYSAWERWLLYLCWFARYCLEGSKSHDGSTSLGYRQPLDDVFITTKAFLAQGAHVNYQTTWLVMRKCPSPLEIEIISPAMFWLETCFNGYPEFRDFPEAVKGQVKIPLRKIAIRSGHRVYPDKKESEMLWPLIEKWLETGQEDDQGELEGTKWRVWEAHERR
ncbi:MAG: hypothetical protein LQ342_005517 [Letrouitia transgressa]|nr:MAG: hypothetical protein LQ342_005517 [Letrouitia transgressa]